MSATPTEAAAPSSKSASESPPQSRLVSLDAYRGFVMMALAFEGFVPGLASHYPDSGIWSALGRQFEHTDWAGGVFWDLIQPSFMLIVGVAMAFSFSSRRAHGQTGPQIAAHVLSRSLVLVMLGWLLGSENHPQTKFMFDDILSQIGLAYPFAYLLVGRSRRTQLTAAAVILTGCWLLFALYPLPSSTFDWSALGLQAGSDPFTGLYAHWNKYTNAAYAFDRWFLNLFPREAVFLGNQTYGATLNFVPSIVTLLFGVMAGEVLRSPRSPSQRLRLLGTAGLGCFVAGQLLGLTICPVVKALWTPSWVLVSGGVALTALAAVYWLADMKGRRTVIYPLVVVGMNPLAMYLMLRLCRAWLTNTVHTHLGWLQLGWSIEFVLVTLIFWLACYWMYRRKIFVRL